MAAKFTKVSKVVLCLLALVPFFSYALEFTLPKDVTEEELANASDEEAQYGSSIDEAEATESENDDDEDEALDTDESDDIEEFAEVDDEDEPDEIEDTETAEIDDDDPGFMEFPLEEPEAETAEVAETETQEVSTEEQGQITGQVFDKETGAPIRGVAIAVEGTEMGTITDEKGNFKLTKVPEGNYTLAYFKTGYLAANITDVAVVSGKAKKVDFALPPRPTELSNDVYDLGTITVTAEQADNMMALIDLKQTSVGSVDFLSAEDMARFGGGDVAGLINKVSGVNVVEGKFAVVRGLGDRYNSTLVNSLPVPSPDPVRQGVQLDLFSTSIIESVIVEKTFLPSLPSNSSGAAFNLKTSSYPEEFTAWFEYGVSVNENTQDLLLRNGNVDPFTGTPGGNEFDLKSIIGRNKVFPSGSEFAAISGEAGDGIFDFGGSGYKVGFGDTFNNMPWGGKLGVITSLSYSSDSATSLGTQQNRYAEESRPSPFPFFARDGSAFLNELPVGSLVYDFTQSTVSEDSVFLVGVGFDLDAEGRHHIDNTYLRSRSNISEVSRRENGFLPEAFNSDPNRALDRGFGQNATATERDLKLAGEIVGRGSSLFTQGQDILSFEQRTLEVKQLAGEHQFEIFGRDVLKFSWGTSFNSAKSEVGNPDPDNFVTGKSSLFYMQNVSGDTIEGSVQTVPFPEPLVDGGYFFGGDTAVVDGFTEDVIRKTARIIDDDHDGYRADLDIELFDALSIQTGLYRDELDRQVDQLDRIKRLNGDAISLGDNLFDFANTANSRNDSQVVDIDLLSFAKITRKIDDQYVQFNASLSDEFEFVFGLRNSDVKMSAEGTGNLLPVIPLTGTQLSFTEADVAGNPRKFDSSGERISGLTNGDLLGFGSNDPNDQIVSGSIDEQYVLPALSIKHNITDNLTLRIDYSETIALPSPRELTPVFTVDTFTGDRLLGNPTLQPSEVDNFGCRLELTSSDNINRIGLSGFYKKIETPIEQIGLTHAPVGIDVLSFINNENDADVLGFELEGRLGLNLLNNLVGDANLNFFEYFSVGGNASLIEAKVGYSESVRLSYINKNTNNGSIYGDSEGNIYIPDERRLFDQPEWTLNFDVAFEQPDWGTSLTVFIYAQSDVLTAVGTGSNLTVDQYTLPYEQLDLNFTQMFGDSWEFEFSVSNILDGERGIVYDTEIINDEVKRFSYKIGRSYGVSLKYIF